MLRSTIFLSSLALLARTQAQCAEWVSCGATSSIKRCVEISPSSTKTPVKTLLACADGTIEQCKVGWNKIAASDGCSGPAFEKELFKPACYQHVFNCFDYL